MLKRILAFLLSTIILTALFVSTGVVIVAESRYPFSYFDSVRKSVIAGNNSNASSRLSYAPHDGDGYIITFRGDKIRVAEALSGYDYRPLAYSSELVFLVYLRDAEPFGIKNRDIIQSIEKDCIRTVKNNNEPDREEEKSQWELDFINASSLPYDSIGDVSKVTIALLDSGVNRRHPALAGANILDGFDITNHYTKVDVDTSGHGTRVAGIIAARTGVTPATGIAQSATILPIRISENGKDIKTSDMIDAIYMAADSGADIINMSFGGYERIRAEEDAINYAASKGCLMVAASGNEGDHHDFAGQYSYPASYDNVISVASISQNGVICGFSQYNDMVDIAAPGEFLTLLGNSGGIVYDNGTSFSAAYVSAAAALADAYAGRRLSSDAFERILEYSCGSATKDEYSGYGVLDVGGILKNCRLPIIYGVSDKTTYFDRVNIFFEGSLATLDGESFADGGSVYTHGSHVLVVKNDFGTRTVNFTLDTIQLRYNYRDMGSYCIFTFNRGKANIDGLPYTSGSRFSLSGKHVFTLIGPNGNTAVKEFELPQGLPIVFGVEDGETYNSSVRITVSGNGSATLNGVPFDREIFLTQAGDYTIELSNSSGSETKELHFRINRTPQLFGFTYTTNADIYTNEANGIAAFTARNGNSVLVMPLDDMNSDGRLLVLPGTVYDVSCVGGDLCVVHEKGFVSYDIATMFSELPITSEIYTHTSQLSDSVIIGNDIYFTDMHGVFYKLPLSSSQPQTLIDTEMSITRIIDTGSYLLLYSPDSDGILLYYSKKNGKIEKSLSGLPCGAPITASDKYICCETGVIDFSYALCLLQYPETDTASIHGDLIITPKYVTKMDGTHIGVYEKDISSVSYDAMYNYLLYSDGSLTRVRRSYYSEETAAFFGAAGYQSDAEDLPYDITPFERNLDISDRRVIDMVVSQNKLYVIYRGINALFVYDADDLKHIDTLFLRYYPEELAMSGDELFIRFTDSEYIWSRKRGYINVPFTPTAIAANRSTVYMIAEARLYALHQSNTHIEMILPQVYAEAIAANDTTLYVAAAFDISAFDASSLELKATTDQVIGGKLRCDGEYLIAGSYLLTGNDLSFVTTSNSAAYTLTGGAVVTSRGLFDINGEQYINHNYSGVSMAVKGPDDSVYIAYNNAIRRISYYGDPASKPGFNIADGSVVKHGEAIECEDGLLYLDGAQVTNSFLPTSGGDHELTAVLPWGIVHSISFSVTHEPESISIRLSRQRLSPGATARLITSIMPTGADGNVIYEVEGDSIVLAEGIVTAVSVGTSKITAHIDGTDIATECVVTISGDNIKCNDPSYKYDPENDSLSGVPANTSVQTLVSKFSYNGGTLYVITADGMIRKDGLVSTGCRLVYRNGSTELESVNISVTGDLDGDGIVTVNDADILYKKLRSDTDFSNPLFKAADINGNGIITSSDLSLLNGIIGRSQHSSISTSLHPEIDAPSAVGGAATFAVTIRSGELVDSTSMMATLTYDDRILEYLSSSYFEGSVSASHSEGKLFFTALDINSASEDRLIKIYFKVKKPSAGITSLKIQGGEVYADTLYSISESEAQIRLMTAADILSAESSNSTLSFAPSVNKYAVSVLENESFFHIKFSLPSGSQLYLPDFSLNGSISEFSVKYITPAGLTVNYLFIVTKTDKLSPADSTAVLNELSVIGHEFDQSFDPHVFLYTMTVDSDCDSLRFDYDPLHRETAISLISPETLVYGSNIITINCKSENGDTAVYTVIVEREYKTEESSMPVEESSESSEYGCESIAEISEMSHESDASGPEINISDHALHSIIIGVAVVIASSAVVISMRRKNK